MPDKKKAQEQKQRQGAFLLENTGFMTVFFLLIVRKENSTIISKARAARLLFSKVDSGAAHFF
ncbi:MAG: hypothetical protein B5M56_03115 [Desulfococcus sp. 4484_241]|nr:MAG: hypothetical protein B5M56_03115 [Desulfococcus sp. 4484_241]